MNKLGHRSPWRNLANQAYKSCSNNFLLGSYGAGCGATTATLKGGQGSSSWKQKYSNGQEYTVGAIVINNAVGNPLLNKGPCFLSGYLEINKEFGGYGTSNENFDHVIRSKRLPRSIGIADTFNQISSNTVIGVVATDAPLSRTNLKRLAIMAHDGIAKSLSPAHTPMDGDTIFAISTHQNNKSELDNIDILAMGSRISDCVARACNRAVYEAVSTIKSKPTWKELFRSK